MRRGFMLHVSGGGHGSAPGGCSPSTSPTPWTPTSAWRPAKRRLRATESRRSSTPTRGSQFTSIRFTDVLTDHDVKISMDGRGRFLDNIFIERPWWTLKYECAYLQDFADERNLYRAINSWITL